MASNAARVRAFHAAIGSPPPARPTIPPPVTLALRRTLIGEEYQEVMAALDHLMTCSTAVLPAPERAAALAQLAHELADLLYVTYGGLADCGIDADAVFAEVHRANLDKTRGPKRADGKQLRPSDWRPADVAGVIASQR